MSPHAIHSLPPSLWAATAVAPQPTPRSWIPRGPMFW